jgi:hypothetical protein
MPSFNDPSHRVHLIFATTHTHTLGQQSDVCHCRCWRECRLLREDLLVAQRTSNGEETIASRTHLYNDEHGRLQRGILFRPAAVADTPPPQSPCDANRHPAPSTAGTPGRHLGGNPAARLEPFVEGRRRREPADWTIRTSVIVGAGCCCGSCVLRRRGIDGGGRRLGFGDVRRARSSGTVAVAADRPERGHDGDAFECCGSRSPGGSLVQVVRLNPGVERDEKRR